MSGAVASRLQTIKDKAGIRSRELARLVGATPQTVSRWQQDRVDPQPEHLDRILTLEWLASELSDFYDPDNARLWLFSRHRLLQGRTPAELIEQGDIDDVLAVIEQLKSGACV